MLFHQPKNSRGNYNFNRSVYTDISFKPHFHKNFELVRVLKGQVRLTVGEKNRVLKPGQYGLVLSNEVHSLNSDGPSLCWVGVFSGDFVRAFESRVRGKEGDDFVFTCSREVESFVCAHLLEGEAECLYLTKASLYAVCSEYSRQVTLQPQSGKSGQFMRSVTDYIAENYRSKVGLTDLAETLGYNYHYLSKCFHKNFGMSFTEFLNSYRLDAALALLTETDKDITEIALESGFQSIRSFNEYFKSRIGTTPVKYRTGSAAR